MRQTGIFGIDIPQLSDKPDITVVSDAIDSVEKNSGGRIEHLKASFSGNNITLNSTVRDKQYTKYYEGLTVMFESPMTLNMSGTYTVSIYNLPQQPLKLKTRVVKGDVVMATWTGQDGFKVANIAGGGGSTSKISVTQNDHGFNFTAVTYDSQLAKYVPTDISKGIQCEGIAVNIDKNTFDLYMEGFVDVDVDVRDDKEEGFSSDEYYFASETVAGKMQKEKPTTIIQTLVYAIRLDNSLKFYINIGQPFDIVQSYITQDNMESFGIASIARAEKIDDKLTKTASDLKKEIDTKLDKGTYSGNASDLKSDIDGKVSKSGDTMTGALTISAPKYPEIIFNDPDLAAVGYSVENEYTYIKAGAGSGLRIYSDNTATLQANNLNTENKEVVAAINELNSRGFVKIGECLIVNQSVSIYGYNEFVVCEKYEPNTILDIKYFTKDIVNSLKSFKFVSYSRELECEWVFSADGNTITLTNLGAASDGGIYVYGR